ncbi:hypothetical protein BRC72_11540 [Halobacteriales archaeon QH_7_66_36]|nr:MAG: hypothetical protein BRC72_11540 [Halobacteriales archaeon QH_7_66_36]
MPTVFIEEVYPDFTILIPVCPVFCVSFYCSVYAVDQVSYKTTGCQQIIHPLNVLLCKRTKFGVFFLNVDLRKVIPQEFFQVYDSMLFSSYIDDNVFLDVVAVSSYL